MKYLTKSRFKLGLECPNKLYYTRKKEYPNKKNEDPFLAALAKGGFQVEELARMHYPNGILVEGNDGAYSQLWEETKNLLNEDQVTIYEPAFLFEGLFIRVDILVKSGNSIKLIEVKSKSFDPYDAYLFIGKRGGMVAGWKPYLFDVAFQKYVMQLCFPDWNIECYIMMADKSKVASINGLNQLFRISKREGNRTGIKKLVNSIDQTGTSVLGHKNVSGIVEDILSNKFLYHENLKFEEAIEVFSSNYQNDTYINWPTSYSCKSCEFRASAEEESIGLKSGFKECFKRQHGWGENEFEKPNIFDIWDFRQGKKIFEDGIIFKDQLTPDLIKLKEDPEKLSRTCRQWIQIEKDVNQDLSIYVDKDGLSRTMSQWRFPLHFIDFETSAAALPFNKGLHPYESVAFQFSHHIYHHDGLIEHANEHINNIAGSFPNFDFVRKLKKALENDSGTIFRYSNHENTILNAIYFQLDRSNESDKNELMTFIQSITRSKRDSAVFWKGERDMEDLLVVIKDFYYNPTTCGSNSIKAVLPAALNSSSFLKKKYSKPIGEINLTSLNFSDDHIWLREGDTGMESPYNLLPSLYEGWTEEEIEESLSEMEDIKDGGAALTAYSKLQYTDMSEREINDLTSAMLKYCELDTLAMVMIYEHLRELIE